MTTSILETITEQYPSFTRSEKKLANYILAHPNESQYLSIRSLAENSEVSESTITRFCYTLGLEGYNSLKLALAKSGQILPSPDAPESLKRISSSDDGLKEMIEDLYNSYITAFKETVEQFNPDSFNKAVDLLSAARRVYCFGSGGSMVMAMEAWARFSVCSSAFIHIADSHMQVIAISTASKEDVILYFSYSGATKDFQDVARISKERGIPIILITHFKNSSAAQAASVTLLCGYNESPLQLGCVPAKMGQLLLIDCLYNAFYRKNFAACSKAESSTLESVSNKLF